MTVYARTKEALELSSLTKSKLSLHFGQEKESKKEKIVKCMTDRRMQLNMVLEFQMANTLILSTFSLYN
jgi:hypothetical protein